LGRAHRQRLVRTAFPGSNLGSSDRASTNVREGHWFSLLGLLPLQSSFSPLPAWLSSRTQAFPTGGLIPRGSLASTHFEAALGISSVQGFVPSAQRLPTRRRPLPPRRLSTATHPVSQAAMTPDSASRSSSTRRCWVPLRCYPLGSSLPSSGFCPPLGPESPPWCLGRPCRRLLPLMTLGV
jgi:hypothetical protein